MIRSADFYRGLMFGLGIMYLMDPDPGRARRARIRDQAADALAKTMTRVRPDHVDDATLAERVRAKLGRYVSHPRAISVESREGCVFLRGPILRSEVEELINAVSSVRGVSEVVNQMAPHDTQDNVPALHGGARVERPSALAPTEWTRGLQLLAGIVGGVALVLGAARVVARIRSDRLREMETENPEYAMLR